MVSSCVLFCGHNHRERCPSGRRRRTRNPLYRLTVPRVRIPLSPIAWIIFWTILFLLYLGEVSEWSMVHAWKACVLKGTGGSNPPFSVFSQSTDSVLWTFTQPRQDRKVAAVSELSMRHRRFVGWVFFYRRLLAYMALSACWISCSKEYMVFALLNALPMVTAIMHGRP